MGLFTLHNCCVSWLLTFLKYKLDSQSRLTIPGFSGYQRNVSHFYLFRKNHRGGGVENILANSPQIVIGLNWIHDLKNEVTY